jgi:hypothetical protein
MPRFRPRFTVRRLMVAVAIVGVIVGGRIEGERRRDRFLLKVIHHYIRSSDANDQRRVLDSPFVPFFDPEGRARFQAKIAALDAQIFYHERMKIKYAWAALYPWLPVWPDTPEPE